jgi:hypothetical protein
VREPDLESQSRNRLQSDLTTNLYLPESRPRVARRQLSPSIETFIRSPLNLNVPRSYPSNIDDYFESNGDWAERESGRDKDSAYGGGTRESSVDRHIPGSYPSDTDDVYRSFHNRAERESGRDRGESNKKNHHEKINYHEDKMRNIAKDTIAGGATSLAITALDIDTAADINNSSATSDSNEGREYLLGQYIEGDQISTDSTRENDSIRSEDSGSIPTTLSVPQ